MHVVYETTSILPGLTVIMTWGIAPVYSVGQMRFP